MDTLTVRGLLIQSLAAWKLIPSPFRRAAIRPANRIVKYCLEGKWLFIIIIIIPRDYRRDWVKTGRKAGRSPSGWTLTSSRGSSAELSLFLQGTKGEGCFFFSSSYANQPPVIGHSAMSFSTFFIFLLQWIFSVSFRCAA